MDGGDGYDRLVGIVQTVLSQAYTVLAYLGLVAVLVLLAGLWPEPLLLLSERAAAVLQPGGS